MTSHHTWTHTRVSSIDTTQNQVYHSFSQPVSQPLTTTHRCTKGCSYFWWSGRASSGKPDTLMSEKISLILVLLLLVLLLLLIAGSLKVPRHRTRLLPNHELVVAHVDLWFVIKLESYMVTTCLDRAALLSGMKVVAFWDGHLDTATCCMANPAPLSSTVHSSKQLKKWQWQLLLS